MSEVDSNLGQGQAAPDSPAGFDVDQFMSDLDSGKPSLPGDDYSPGVATTTGAGQAPNPAQQAAAPKSPAQQAAQQVAQEIELVVNGKQVKGTLDQIKQWASKGYHYNQQAAELTTKQQEIEKIRARYAEIEDFAAKNPGWIESVNQAWLQSKQGSQQDTSQLPPAVAQELNALKAQLSDVVKFKESSEAQRLQQRHEQEDQALNGEIQSLREQFKDLDWNAVSSDGQALDARVLKFMQDNHIGVKPDGSYVPGSFERAFKAYNHDQLVKRAETRAKEDVIKARKAETKLGLLGQSSTPKKGQITNAENYKNKSLSELADEAINELGLGA
jgi:hypothetical protein